MAQLYSKKHQSSVNTFDGHKMFASSVEEARTNASTYFDVLDVFRRIFKNITNKDLLV